MSVRVYPPETRAAAIADYQTGLTLDQTATRHGVSSSAVWTWLNNASIVRRPAAPPSSVHRVCTIDDCTRPHRARGYCGLHYGRLVKGAKPRGDVDHDARLEDCRWMAATGEGLTSAAQRLGLKAASLDAWLRDHDRATLSTLTAQEPLPLNTSRATFHGAGKRAT